MEFKVGERVLHINDKRVYGIIKGHDQTIEKSYSVDWYMKRANYCLLSDYKTYPCEIKRDIERHRNILIEDLLK